MSKIENILRQGGEALSFVSDGEFLSAVGEISDRYDEIAKQLDSFTTPEALIDQLVAGVNNPALTTVLKKLGLEGVYKKIKKHIGKIEGLADGDLKPYLKLLKPVRSFDENGDDGSGAVLNGVDDGLIQWNPISVKKVLSSGQKKNYALNLSADATIDIEAGDTWPFASDNMPDPLLRLGFAASVEAGAHATLPFKLGFVAGSLDTQAAVDCDYFFDLRGNEQSYASAVGSSLKRLPNPFDYDALWEAFADPKVALAGLRLAYDGHIDIDLDVAIGKKFSFAEDVSLSADLTVNVGVKRPGSFELTMRAGRLAVGGGRTIIISLSRGKAKARSYALGLGLELDLSGIAPRIHRLLSDALGHWDEGLADIKPFLSPGTWVKDNLPSELDDALSGLLKNDKLRRALSDDLMLIIGRKADDDSAVISWLKQEVTGKLDDISLKATSEAEEVSKQIIGKISNQLPSVLQGKLEGKLEAVVGALLKTMTSKFEDTAGDIFDKGDPKKLGSSLKKLGDMVGDKVEDLDDMLARIRGLVGRYDGLFRKVVDATKDSARAKISASLEIEEQRIEEESFQFSGEFLEQSEDTRRIFKALLHGKFQQAAMTLTEETPGFELDRAKSSVTRFSERSTRLGYEVVLFGFSLSGHNLLSSSASIAVSGDGHIEVEAEGVRERELSALGESRSVRFVVGNSILLARASEGKPPGEKRFLDLGLHFSHKDKSLKRKELEMLIGSLQDERLLPDGAMRQAADIFTEWSGKGSNSKIRANVDIRFMLRPEGPTKLLQISANDVGNSLDRREQVEVFRTIMNAMRETEQLRERTYERALKIVSKMTRIEGPDAGDDAFLLYVHDFSRKPSRNRGEYADMKRDVARGKNFVEIIELMRLIYFSRPKGMSGLTDGAGWDVQKYRDAERKIGKLAGKWLKLHASTFSPLFGFRRKLDERMLAFMLALKNLSGGESGAGISVIMTHQPANAEPQTRVLI